MPKDDVIRRIEDRVLLRLTKVPEKDVFERDEELDALGLDHRLIDLLSKGDISGWFHSHDGGPYLQAFETKFADFCGTKYAFAVSSGNAAIYIGLRAVGIKPDDWVAVPAYTHVGSVAPIVLAGARPLFIDVEKDGNMRPKSLYDAIAQEEVKAIIPVHQLGKPCRMKDFPTDIRIVEDASHALGSIYMGLKAGNLGDVGCFSIGGGRTKIICCGEGGMITTNSDVFAERIKNIRNHGDRVTDIDYHCFNFRLSELNALVGLIQMEKVRELIRWQVENAEYLINNLPSYLESYSIPFNIITNRYLVGCRFNSHKAGMTRDQFLEKVKAAGFEGGVPRMNVGPGYSKLVQDITFYSKWRRKLPMSAFVRDTSVWLDWHRHPRTRDEIDKLLECFRGIVK